MKNQNLKDKIDEIFKKDERFWDKERKVILRNTISDYAENFDEKFLEMLLSDKTAKEHFFKKVGKMMIFDKEKFLAYINNKDFLENSYTKFTQNIGLTDEGQFLKSAGKVILHWPYKDCILEGGQTKESVKRNEIFFNEVLEKDEIDVLLKPKVFSKFEKFSRKNGKAKGEKLEEFVRDESGIIKDNLIVKGNNLIVLHSLKEEFAGKVKLIYIDPPYNTGNDGFKYNDNFNHSSWLTFMKNRLEVARDLLADDGVIFVQCDDNEQAYLKVLMDEIFLRENFVGTLIHQRAKGGGNAKYIVKGHDYICIYAKNLSDEHRFVREKIVQSKIIEMDGKYFLRNDDVVRKVFGKYDKSLGDRRCFFEELKIYKNEKQIKEINEKIKKGEYVLEDNGQGKHLICKYTPVEDSYSKLYSIVKALSEYGNSEMIKLGLEFSNPKPESIIKFIIESVTKENDLVLDFFAGSGTSGAVAHKMGRQYILVEQMDYIKDLPEARIKKVIEGEQGGISKAVNWKGGGEFVYMEMKEFNQEFLTAIKKAKSKEDLKEIYDDIQEKAFLSYRFTDERFKAKISEFNELDLNEQKQVLAEILDKNLLYLSYSEMEDIIYKISKKDININDNFYNK